jgi:hypothetical protein
MSTTITKVLKSSTPYSKSTFDLESTRSDGRKVVPGNPKPTTSTDKKIHIGHIVGSGWYNLDHTHDHTVELAFDYNRLAKEVPKKANDLQMTTLKVLNPIFKKMSLKLEKM